MREVVGRRIADQASVTSATRMAEGLMLGMMRCDELGISLNELQRGALWAGALLAFDGTESDLREQARIIGWLAQLEVVIPDGGVDA